MIDTNEQLHPIWQKPAADVAPKVVLNYIGDNWIEVTLNGEKFFSGYSMTTYYWCLLLEKFGVTVEKTETADDEDD